MIEVGHGKDGGHETRKYVELKTTMLRFDRDVYYYSRRVSNAMTNED